MVNFGKLKFKFQYMFLKNFWNLPLPITTWIGTKWQLREKFQKRKVIFLLILKFTGNDPTTGYPRTILEAMADQFLSGIFLSMQDLPLHPSWDHSTSRSNSKIPIGTRVQCYFVKAARHMYRLLHVCVTCNMSCMCFCLRLCFYCSWNCDVIG